MTKKQHRLDIEASLSKALEAPARPRPSPALSAMLAEYAPPAESAPAPATPVTTPVDTPVITPVTTPVSEPAPPPEPADRQPPQYLDATHTSSEGQIYSIMYRETVSKNLRDRHFGPTELMQKTGIRSDRTVRRAIDGLIAKLSVEIVAYAEGSPLGPRYRVYKPKEIEQRRRAAGLEIDPYTRRIVTPATTPVTTPVATGANPDRGTPAKNTPVTGVEIAGVIKYRNDPLSGPVPDTTSSSNDLRPEADDEPAALAEVFKQLERELTGKNSARGDQWRELAEVLAAELRIAAARTTVSNVPAFLAEHLRRRLWKLDKKQAREQGRELPDQVAASAPGEAAPAECPDCKGSGWWYPEGQDKGVTKCKHSRVGRQS